MAMQRIFDLAGSRKAMCTKVRKGATTHRACIWEALVDVAFGGERC